MEGHGGTLPKFSLKMIKNFPLHFWKIFAFLISLYSPLLHGMWILDSHPLVETLAYLAHCVSLHAWTAYKVIFFLTFLFKNCTQSFPTTYIFWACKCINSLNIILWKESATCLCIMFNKKCISTSSWKYNIWTNLSCFLSALFWQETNFM